MISRWGKRRWRIEGLFKTAKRRSGLARFGQGTLLGARRFLTLSLLASVRTVAVGGVVNARGRLAGLARGREERSAPARARGGSDRVVERVGASTTLFGSRKISLQGVGATSQPAKSMLHKAPPARFPATPAEHFLRSVRRFLLSPCTAKQGRSLLGNLLLASPLSRPSFGGDGSRRPSGTSKRKKCDTDRFSLPLVLQAPRPPCSS